MADGEDRDWAELGLVGKGALAFAGTFIAIGLFVVGAALPVLQRAFADTPNVGLLIQLLGGIVAPVFAIMSPLAGRVVARLGVRNTYMLSLVLFTIGGVGPAFCTELWQMLLFRILLGCAVAGGFTAGMSGIARLPESQRHILFGLTSFFGGAICILALPMVGVLAKEGWRYAFAVHLIMLPVGLLALGLPRRKGGSVVAMATGRAAAPIKRVSVPAPLLIIAAIVGWTMVSSTIYAPFRLAAIGLTDPAQVGAALGFVSICSLIGSGSYGFIHKFFGTRTMMLLGLGGIAAGCLVVAIGQALPLIVTGYAILGLGLSLFTASIYAAAIDAVAAAGGSDGAATGMVSFALYLPQILFPVIASYVGGRFGTGSVYMLLSGLTIAGLLLLIMRPSGGRPAATAGA